MLPTWRHTAPRSQAPKRSDSDFWTQLSRRVKDRAWARSRSIFFYRSTIYYSFWKKVAIQEDIRALKRFEKAALPGRQTPTAGSTHLAVPLRLWLTLVLHWCLGSSGTTAIVLTTSGQLSENSFRWTGKQNSFRRLSFWNHTVITYGCGYGKILTMLRMLHAN